MRLAAAVLLLVATVVPATAEPAPAWDRKRAKTVGALAERWWKARPKTLFEAWDPAVRAALRDEAKAQGAIPEGARLEVVATLWKPVQKLGPRHGRGKATVRTPLGDGAAWFVVSGGGRNKGLVIGLHGGGPGAAPSPATSWKMPKCMGMYPSGRSEHDTWNTVWGERFLLTMIEIAKAQYQIDPDRVYVGGFSMGGTGSWFMAGRHPDLLAGAMPYHGVLMANPKSQLADKKLIREIQPGIVPNARNLAMWYTTGTEDKNCMPGTYLYVWDMILKLREEDPGGYAKIHFKAHEGVAHAFPGGEPGRAYKFLAKETRDTFPETVVWEASTNPMPRRDHLDRDAGIERYQKRWFYWLRCEKPRDRQVVRATRRGNEITLDVTGRTDGAKGITILLNEEMIDPAKEVVVRDDAGKELYRGKPVPDLWTVLESLDARLDRRMVFDRRIEL